MTARPTPRPRIRRAKVEDCAALIELQREFYREDRLEHSAANTRALRRLLRSPEAGAVWIIEAPSAGVETNDGSGPASRRERPGAATGDGGGRASRRDRETIGYLVLTLGYTLELGGRDAFIDELYVDPRWRGRGLGVRAIEIAEAGARRLGVGALHLEVDTGNERARRLYERWGFRVRDRYHLMLKRLAGR